jgi:hypothetical protein
MKNGRCSSAPTVAAHAGPWVDRLKRAPDWRDDGVRDGAIDQVPNETRGSGR